MKRLACFLLFAALLCCAAASVSGNCIGTVATEEEMTEVIDLDLENLSSVTADCLKDGVYPLRVDSSSAMFKIVDCRLTVADGSMTARLYMKSTAYSYMYAGSARQAAQADIDALIPLEEDETGRYFDLPVDALDAGTACAALSARKQAWYPRTLVFRSDSLPPEAFLQERLVTAASLSLADGTYECEAKLEGKGRTGVLSPAVVTVDGGACRARIVFSTAKIDYIIIDGEKLAPVTVEGGAAFDIPFDAFDRKIAVTVDSTAIRPATEVSYSLTFFSETLRLLAR